MSARHEVRVRFCPHARPTWDAVMGFHGRLPCRGESIRAEGSRYVIVDVEWNPDGEPLLVAHYHERPEARRVLGRV